MRGLSLAALLVILATSGCGGGTNTSAPGTVTHDNPSAPASPEPETGNARLPLKDCPVTDPLKERDSPPPSPMPAGPDKWVGVGPLWADLSQLEGVNGAATYKVRFKAFIAGEPVVTVKRLDEPGQGAGRVTAAQDNGQSFWDGEVTVGGGGCWLVTATIGEHSVGFVMRS
ncbi:MAG TPA: hypothetical protein VFC19_15925 [Candidatus Limnocylindrales bacterium]|nr:hypothetical protein [Candidatus Limnocylindrales bacterium]